MLLKAFKPNLIDYINLSKILDNYVRRCKCTGGDSRVGLGWWGGASVFLRKTFLVLICVFGLIL